MKTTINYYRDEKLIVVMSWDNYGITHCVVISQYKTYVEHNFLIYDLLGLIALWEEVYGGQS